MCKKFFYPDKRKLCISLAILAYMIAISYAIDFVLELFQYSPYVPETVAINLVVLYILACLVVYISDKLVKKKLRGRKK